MALEAKNSRRCGGQGLNPPCMYQPMRMSPQTGHGRVKTTVNDTHWAQHFAPFHKLAKTQRDTIRLLGQAASTALERGPMPPSYTKEGLFHLGACPEAAVYAGSSPQEASIYSFAKTRKAVLFLPSFS